MLGQFEFKCSGPLVTVIELLNEAYQRAVSRVEFSH